jgi:hypothetical protein
MAQPFSTATSLQRLVYRLEIGQTYAFAHAGSTQKWITKDKTEVAGIVLSEGRRVFANSQMIDFIEQPANLGMSNEYRRRHID